MAERERLALDRLRSGTPLERAAGEFGLTVPDLRKVAEQHNLYHLTSTPKANGTAIVTPVTPAVPAPLPLPPPAAPSSGSRHRRDRPLVMPRDLVALVAPAYPVESGIPIPHLPHSLATSLRSLKAHGESFLLPCAPYEAQNTAARLKRAIYIFRKFENTQVTFIFAAAPGGVRVWRKD